MNYDEIQSQVNKRRTFAIISHPDAGKTTLTEKLRLFGGAIRMDRRSEGPENQQICIIGLDADRKRTRYFRDFQCHAV